MWKEKIFNRVILQEIIRVHSGWVDKSILGDHDRKIWEELLRTWVKEDMKTMYLEEVRTKEKIMGNNWLKEDLKIMYLEEAKKRNQLRPLHMNSSTKLISIIMFAKF